MSDKSLLTVKEKILLHLSEFPSDRYITDDQQKEIFGILPHALSQKGIADAVGIRWNHVPRSLKGLVTDELVQVRSGMVEGHMRRVNVYFLTRRGMEDAIAIREKLRDIEIKVRSDDRVQDMSVPSVVEFLGGTVTPLTVLVMSNDGKDVVGLEALKKLSAGEQNVSTRVHVVNDAPSISRFIGREIELESMRKILDERKVLVVSGITGIGKSTLVSRLVDGLKVSRSIIWCNITEWDTVRMIQNRIGEFFSLNGRRELKKLLARGSVPDNEAIAQMRECMSAVPTLFVFDNVEKGNEEVMKFLRMLLDTLIQEDLKMVLISRTLPDLYDRREVSVRFNVGEIKLYGLTFEGTEELLSIRGFTGKNADVLYKITGGHPLALELIRNPDDVKKPSDLFRFVQDELLSGLDGQERNLLNYASVLTYPNEIDALLHIDPPIEALDKLIDLNLIQDLPSGMIYLHNLVREVAFSRLSADEVREHCRAAAEYFLGKGTVYDSLKGIRYLIKGEYYDDACELIGDVGSGALDRGLMSEVRNIMAEIEDHVPTDQSYKIFILKGDMELFEGDREGARQAFERALRSTSESNYLSRAHVHRQMGLLALSSGDIAEANNDLRIALDMANRSGDKAVLATVNGALARLHIHRGEHAQARELLDIAMEYALEANHDIVYHDLLIDAGSICNQSGDVDKALDLARVSLAYFEARDDVYKLARVFMLMAEIVTGPEDTERAIQHWDMATDAARKSGAHDALVTSLVRSTDPLTKLGRHDEALRRLGEAERILEDEENLIALDDLHKAYGLVLMEKGDMDGATAHLENSLTIAGRIDAPLRVADAEHLLGRLLARRGEKKEAKAHLDNAVRTYKERGQAHRIQPILDELESLKKKK